MENCTADAYFAASNFTERAVYCSGIGQGFNWSANCEIAFSWYNQHQFRVDPYGFGEVNDTININFTRSILPVNNNPNYTSDFEDLLLELIYQELVTGTYLALLDSQNHNLTESDNITNLYIASGDIEDNCAVAEIARQSPDPIELNYTDTNTCLIILAQYTSFNDDPVDWDPLDGYFAAFRSSLPTQYQNISDYLLLEWFESIKAANRSVPSVQEAWNRCGAQMCSGSSGNPDLTGIGIFISYIIEAVLATVIIMATCFHNWSTRTSENTSAAGEEPLRGRFIEATDMFLDTALFFELSLVVAITIAGAYDTVLYNQIVCQAASFFASSALIAVAATPRSYTARRTSFWIVLFLCMLVLTVTSFTSLQLLRLAKNGDFPDLQDIFCLAYGIVSHTRDRLFVHYLYASQLMQAIVYCGFLALYFLYKKIVYPLFLRKRQYRDIPQVWTTRLRYTYALFALINMWFGLIALHEWRNLEGELFGADDEDRKWSYGQILSLFIWLPVFTTFAQIGAKQYRNSFLTNQGSDGFELKMLWHRKKLPPVEALPSHNNNNQATDPQSEINSPVPRPEISPSPAAAAHQPLPQRDQEPQQSISSSSTVSIAEEQSSQSPQSLRISRTQSSSRLQPIVQPSQPNS